MSTIKVGPLDTRNNLSDLASASRAVANLQITFVATGTGTVNVLNGGPLAGTYTIVGWATMPNESSVTRYIPLWKKTS